MSNKIVYAITILFLTTIIIASFQAAFRTDTVEASKPKSVEPQRFMKTIVYEGCEYIYLDIETSQNIIHKANCSFCLNSKRK
jgi:hypothetical protein